MLLGRDHREYGRYHLEELAPGLAGAISVGADKASPSLRAKGDRSYPNEDALLIVAQGPRALAAVADSHFGIHASHGLIEALHEVPELPRTAAELEAALHDLRPPAHATDCDSSASTLVVLTCDLETRSGSYYSWGDSTLAAVGPSGYRPLSKPRAAFVSPATLRSALKRSAASSFELAPDERLLLFTDGVNECHYREPDTSITADHIARLAAGAPSAPALARALIELALAGVDGHPGGQDNIALVVM